MWLHADGRLSVRPDGVDDGLEAELALLRAARWASGRRTASFERLFPPDPFHPEAPVRTDRLSPAQAGQLLDWLEAVLEVAGQARENLRSACATILSHVVASGGRDHTLADAGRRAAELLFVMAARETRGPLRGHILHLLQLRGPALSDLQRDRAVALLRGMVRVAPPYADLPEEWNFAMCSTHEFHEGECETLCRTHRFKEVPRPAGAPPSPSGWGRGYRVFEAPFRNQAGGPIRIYARSSTPLDEHGEMAEPAFVGLLVNRHAELGANDMRAATVRVEQQGYKLYMNSECAGLTTRFAVTRLFPEADVYSSWDSTYFRTERGGSGKVIASEGLDCFVAVLAGMAEGEDHAGLSERIRTAQWQHDQAWVDKGFVQFVGPSHPDVIARFEDVNRDGRADLYDGFLDFDLAEIAEDIADSATPRDPGIPASAISGAAADGLAWASGSMNRVVQYSDLWAGLPDHVEQMYAFVSGGFYSHEAPPDGIGGRAEDYGRLPALARFPGRTDAPGGFRVECLLHAWLAHAGKELKRLLLAAEVFHRAFDLGFLRAEGDLATPLGRRGMLLLTFAGLLEFPADQNQIDALWSLALKNLGLPDLSRSFVRGCINEVDHAASNYYGSKRGLAQLLGQLRNGDPVLLARLSDADPRVGRAWPLAVG